MPHSRDPPFDDVAEVFIVNVVVLPANSPLSAFLQFVLAISVGALNIVDVATRSRYFIHFDELVSRQPCNDLIQFFWLKTHSICKFVIFQTGGQKGQDNGPCQWRYIANDLHRMTAKLVQNDDVFWLVKCPCNVLDEITQYLLVFLRRHPVTMRGEDKDGQCC
jgi:hypothetical protein